MKTHNRQWIFKTRPQGALGEDNFEYREAEIPKPDLSRGQLLVQNLWFSFDPAMRTWMSPAVRYLPPTPLGEPMRSAALSRVLQSENPDFPVGATVQGLFGWEDYSIADPANVSAPGRIPDDVASAIPPDQLLGILGGTGVTAWLGMKKIGMPQAGETVLVSSAAGATGSVAAQIARIAGSRVIGIAGGSEKCEWLTEQCRLSATIDYRAEDVRSRLKTLAPDGVQLFFDNVGGDILEAALNSMADHGRIVLCGQIAGYDGKMRGPENIMEIVFRSLTVRGFVMMHYLEHMEAARTELAGWLHSGELSGRSDIQRGFENIPGTLLRLFRGENKGKQVLEVTQPAG